MIRLPKNHRGFSILELQLAIMLTIFLIITPTIFLQPALAQIILWNDSEQTRQKAVFAMESIRSDIAGGYNIVVDSGKCYQYCQSDASGNRIYYYLNTGANINGYKLLRKSETASAAAISCTGGTIVASQVNTSETAFGTAFGILTAKIAVNGENSLNNLTLYSRFLPTIKEQDYALYEDWECNSLNQGWVNTNGASGGTWALLTPTVQTYGRYELVMNKTLTANEIAYIEIPLDMSRFDAATVSFRYMSAGAFSTGDEQFVIDWYNGTSWSNIFSTTAGATVAASTLGTAVVSSGLNSSSRIRIAGRLTDSAARWYVDNISVYVP